MSFRLPPRLRREHLVYALLMALTLAGLLLAGGASFALSVHNRASAGFVWRTVLNQPAGFLSVALQALVIVVIHLLFFSAVYRIGTAGTRPGRWFERPASCVALTWLAACWLILDYHNDRFALSVWAYHLGPITDAPAASLLSALAAIWLLFRGAQGLRAGLGRYSPRRGRWLAAAAVVPLAALAIHTLPATTPTPGSVPAQRNLVIIGLDSMRRDLAVDEHGAAAVPALAAVRREAYVEANVVTPLAHTFPSWTTILTGLHPQRSGARYNLAARAGVDSAASLAWTLKQQGYRTIYATDETRFSNVGHNFGFDEVIAPEAGVSDFLLAQFLDQPLVNLAVQLPGMEILLPALTGNRAFAQAYEPERFLQRLERAIGAADGRPTFIAVHLCLAHWPFFSAERAEPLAGFPSEVYYPSAVQVDRQFEHLRARLRRLGYLRPDGLEVILADHGEGVAADHQGQAEPQLHGGLKQAPATTMGHGNSLLLPQQWQTFTLFRGQSAAGPIPVGRSEQLASLEDVAPTIQRLLGLPIAATARTMSVAAVVAGQQPLPARPYVLMETGFTPAGFDAANPDGDKALRIAESSFDVQADGRVEMKAWVYADTLPFKQIGITDGQRGLIVTGRQQRPMIVVQDYARGSSDIYPADTRLAGTPLPLLAEACGEASIRERIPAWCAPANQAPDLAAR